MSACRRDRCRANNHEVLVEGGPFVQTARELEPLVVGVFAGKPVYLREIAAVTDGPEEPAGYARIQFGPGTKEAPAGDYPAVTVAVAKQGQQRGRRGPRALRQAR